jgi:nitroreductase
MNTIENPLKGARAKPAPVQAPILEPITLRWSPRAFTERSIPGEVLHRIFEAARWAPSAFNEQPWAFVIAKRSDTPAFQSMLSCLNEANQAWARNADLLVFTAARNDLVIRPGPNKAALYDLGQSVAYLSLQATVEGVAVHQMVGFDADRAAEVSAIPSDHRCLTALALGYPGDPQSLPDALRERELAPRIRKPVSEFVFGGTWKSGTGI